MKSIALKASFAGILAGPIARDSVWSLCVKLAGVTLGFVQGILAARLLGAEGLGIASIALSVGQIVSFVAALGLGGLAVREIPRLQASRQRQQIAPFVNSAFRATAVAGTAAAVAAIAAVAIAPLPSDHVAPFAIAAMAIPLLAVASVSGGALRGFGATVRSQLTDELVRRVVTIVALIFVLVGGVSLSPSGFVAVHVVAVAIVAILGLALVSPLLRSAGGPADRRTCAVPLRASLPFLWLALAGLLQGEINTILLGLLADAREAGLYQPIARLTPLLVLPIQAAGMRYAPRMAYLWERGEVERVHAITFTFTWVTTAMTVVGAAALVICGPLVLSLYGPQFVSVAPALAAVAAAQVFNAASGPVGMLQVAIGRGRAALLAQLAGLATTVVGGALLIPQLGAIGAVYGLCASIIVVNIANAIGLFAATGIAPWSRPKGQSRHNRPNG